MAETDRNGAQALRENAADSFFTRPPGIELPKGGGAIRGIGEKFDANPVTGTASFTVPLALSPGRSNFGPKLSLAYDSGGGNGPFGLGWSLALPAISRKTDRGLPQYDDEKRSDVFLLSGAEDLVPVLIADANGTWTLRPPVTGTLDGDAFDVYAYAPRIEGLFARIERWVRRRDRDTRWRSISRDNITTWYGATPASRISDPADAARIFSWLISESHDDKGNVIVYDYAAEDSERVDLLQVNERNRTVVSRAANRYIKRIKYGNKASRVADPSNFSAKGWMFEAVFDYGEGHFISAGAPVDDRSYVNAWSAPPQPTPWPARQDAFSTCRPGFELRTYRLCRRVLMFHNFDELGTTPCLVRSTEFAYDEAPVASFITSISHSGYVRQKDANELYTDSYLQTSLPPLELVYSKVPDVAQLAALPVDSIDISSVENLPHGVDGGEYRWVDLDGEGISGILSEQRGAWYYKENLGHGQLAPVNAVSQVPTLATASSQGAQLLDLAGDGQLDLVTFDSPMRGFHERTLSSGWEPFQAFQKIPNVAWRDPNLRFIDLTGDGHADVVISEDEAFVWYPSLAEDGFAPAQRVNKALDEERGPCIVFSDPAESIFLADMSGDGLTDLVRIRSGEICYWPNLGYGRFGTKVTFDGSPVFDAPDQFDYRRLHLADIDGSGTTDIIYFHRDGARLHFNRSGNSFSEAVAIPQFPPSDDLTALDVVDLFGSGTACLVRSSPLPGVIGRRVLYVDLMDGHKPHLLVKTLNNMGATTEVQYAPSTKFYLADKLAETPWKTRLPFPVHCVERVTVSDKWRDARFTTTYDYHHGHYDGIEREFRGFARVGRLDVESYGVFAERNVASPYITPDKILYQPPVMTVTWYHTGGAGEPGKVLSHLRDEYFPAWFEAKDPATSNVLGGFHEKELPEPELGPDPLSEEEWREALRACKGMVLRQEIYELKVDALEAGTYVPTKLFSSACHNCHIRRLQPRGENPHAIFLVTESEALTCNYELDLTTATLTPDPRVTHALNLRLDQYGNVLQSVSVAYPRIASYSDASLPSAARSAIDAVQRERHVVYAENRFTGDVDAPDDHRLRLPCETRAYEVTGISPGSGFYFSVEELQQLDLSDFYAAGPAATPVKDIPYQQIPSGMTPERRLVEHTRTLFLADTLAGPLTFTQLGSLGLVYETYKLALTETLLQKVFGNKLTAASRVKLSDASVSGYLSGAALAARFAGLNTTDQYWVRSGVAGFAPGADQRFYFPEAFTDPFGNVSTVTYDGKYHAYVQSTSDASGNRTSIEAFDFRALAPRALKDVNDNISEAYFDGLGLLVAIALKGKGAQGDSFAGWDDGLANPGLEEIESFFTAPYDEAEARRLLGNATTRYAYYMGQTRDANGTVIWGVHPPCAAAILRERHLADLAAREQSALQVAFEYSDGLGSVVVKKGQAEPAPGSTGLRWIATGKTILNNKGKAVKQYEPYFSASDHRFEEPSEAGVTPVLYYDATGRLIRTEIPDGTFTRVEFSPWHVAAFDPDDTVRDSTWYADRGSPNPNGAQPSSPSSRAAWLAAQHHGTPTVTILDSLGRDVITIAHNSWKDSAGVVHDAKYVTRTKLDAEGKPLWIRDARGNLAMQYIAPAKPNDDPSDTVPPGSVACYDIAGSLLLQHSMDAGDRWLLNDAAGKPLFAWDVNDRQDDATGLIVSEHREFQTEYDALHRPVKQWLSINGGPSALIERFVYGEGVSNDRDRNIRGRLYQHFDQGGINSVERLGFDGKPRETQRTLVSSYEAPVIDWQAGSPTALLENETFVRNTDYDALGRVTRLYNWHRAADRVAVYIPSYNERGLLVRDTLDVGATKTSTGHTPSGRALVTPIAEVRYSAKGQKEYLRLGNGTLTQYDYDPQTFRLVQIRTTRPSDPSGFPARRSNLQDPGIVQQLLYTYDPVGNITEVEDQAYEPVFFDNQQVQPRGRYVYDALYRLIAASGRENAQATAPPTQLEPPPFNVQFPLTAQALRNYTETYEYDSVGNIKEVHHVPMTTAALGEWTRHYEYQPDSNRLQRTWEGNNQTAAVNYHHDRHGNMVNLANVASSDYLRWDYRDMIRAIDLGGGGWAYYNYDSSKQRTRKVIADRNGNKQWERLYLGGLEIYRRYVAGALTEEIESHHDVEGANRILLVDDILETASTSGQRTLYRYQYGNHLGSACIELDDQAEIISCEEYYPYGATAYRATNSSIEAPARRYRYTGMETDEESGFMYQAARYYAPSIARWTAPDAVLNVDEIDAYAYVSGNPVRFVDRTGSRKATPDEAQRLALLQDLMSRELQKWERKAVVFKVLDSFLPGGPLGRYKTAAAHYRAYADAIDRAEEGQAVLGWDSTSLWNPEYYYDENGNVIATLTYVPSYQSAKEAYRERQMEVGAALAYSPVSTVAYGGAKIVGASPETADSLAIGGAAVWDVAGGASAMHEANAANQSMSTYQLGPREEVAHGAPLEAVPRPSTAAADQGTGPAGGSPSAGGAPSAGQAQGGGGTPQPPQFAVGRAGEEMANFSVKNSAVSGPEHLMNNKSTLKDASGKTVYASNSGRRGARFPDIPIAAAGGAVGTVEVKTPFGGPVDPLVYLANHPGAATQMSNEATIMSKGPTFWGPSENMSPVVPGEGVGIAAGYWVWFPPKGVQ